MFNQPFKDSKHFEDFAAFGDLDARARRPGKDFVAHQAGDRGCGIAENVLLVPALAFYP